MKKYLLAASVTLGALCIANGANAAAICSNATVKGTYVYAEGVQKDGKESAIAGFEYWDGAGNLIGIENDSSDKVTGKTAAEAVITDHAGNGDTTKYKGTYKVEGDCRGVAVYDDGTTTRIFVEPSGDEFHFISLDNGSGGGASFGENHRYSAENLLAE